MVKFDQEAYFLLYLMKPHYFILYKAPSYYIYIFSFGALRIMAKNRYAYFRQEYFYYQVYVGIPRGLGDSFIYFYWINRMTAVLNTIRCSM